MSNDEMEMSNEEIEEPVPTRGTEADNSDSSGGGCSEHLFVPNIDDNDFEEWTLKKIPMLLHPECNFCSYWDLLSMVLILYSCLTIPYRLAFSAHAKGMWKLVDRGVDLTFMVDICITFRTAIKPSDVLITSPLAVAKDYLSGWFILDFMSSFPFDLVLEIFTDAANPDAARILKVIRIGRMLKILRMVRLQRLLKKLQDSLGIKNGVMTSIKFGLFIMLCAHMEACIWFSVSTNESQLANNWALGYCIKADSDNFNADCGNICDFYTCEEKCCFADVAAGVTPPPQCDFMGGDNRTKCIAQDGGDPTVPWCKCMSTCMQCDVMKQYVASLYWSLVTMTTLGYGDITPANNIERLFCVWAMLLGACIFAYSVTNMCTLVHNLDPSAVYFRNRVDQLNDMMDYMSLPKETRKRIMDFFFFKMNRSTVCIYNQDLILKDLSKTLCEDVQFVSLHLLIENIPFFQDCERGFIGQIATKLKGDARAPGDVICEQGRISIQMYMLRKGSLECVRTKPSEGVASPSPSGAAAAGDQTEIMATLGDGSVFSVAALFRASKFGFTANVLEYADIYALTKYDFDLVLSAFHLDKEAFFTKAEEAGLAERDSNDEQFAKKQAEEESEAHRKRKLETVRKQIQKQTEYINMLMN